MALSTFFWHRDVEGLFIIQMTEIVVEYVNAKSRMAVTVASYMMSSYLD